MDELFTTGCVLCGADANFRLGYSMGNRMAETTRANMGDWLCENHSYSETDAHASDAEITRRKSLLRRAETPAVETKPEKREPKVGERVECSYDAGFGLIEFTGTYAGRPDKYDHAIHRDDGVSGAGNYGAFLFSGFVRPLSRPPVGSAEVLAVSGAEAVMKPAGGGSSKKDPYAAVREFDEQAIHAAAHPRELPATPQVAMFLSWQEKQHRKLAQAKSELDRKLTASTHPATWPEGSGEEMFNS